MCWPMTGPPFPVMTHPSAEKIRASPEFVLEPPPVVAAEEHQRWRSRPTHPRPTPPRTPRRAEDRRIPPAPGQSPGKAREGRGPGLPSRVVEHRFDPQQLVVLG